MLSNFRQRRSIRLIIKIQHGNRVATWFVLFATQCHVSNVDTMLAADIPDETNDARFIDVLINQQQAIEIRIQMELVDANQTQELLAEDRSRCSQFTVVSHDGRRNQRREISQFVREFFLDFDTPFFGQQIGVDDIDVVGQGVGKQSRCKGVRDQFRLFVCRLTLELQLHSSHTTLIQL